MQAAVEQRRFDGLAPNKPRSLARSLCDADLVTLDLLHVVPQCYAPQPIDDDVSPAAWATLRFSCENVFADEVAAFALEQQQSGFLVPCEALEPMDLDNHLEPMDCSSHESSTDALQSGSLDIPLDGLCKLDAMLSNSAEQVQPWRDWLEAFYGSPEADVTVDGLLAAERDWTRTLDRLYSGGSRVGADAQVASVKSAICAGVAQAEQMLQSEVLAVHNLYKLLDLKNRAEAALLKCGLLESQALAAKEAREAEPQQLVSLVWVSQPLARSFKNKNRARVSNKKRKGHCTLQAALVRAPGVSFEPTTPVTAAFYAHPEMPALAAPAKPKGKSRRKRPSEEARSDDPEQLKTDIQLHNNVERLENDRVAFNFRFPAGTRNRPCTIRLHVRGTLTRTDGSGRARSEEVDVMSEPTHCFIVTTNECQYEGAELKLLAMELYPAGQASCTWARFVNALELRWMRVTRQESDSVIDAVEDRVLSQGDMRYLAQRFFGCDERNPQAPAGVAYSELCEFYSFFGKVTHVYRHNAAVRQLLLDGVIWGFISKEETVQRLSQQQPGAFLVRVSDVQPGTFVVSWHDPQSRSVRHARLDSKLLIQPLGAIADYLGSKPFLRSVYSPFTRVGSRTEFRPSLRDKHEALGRFYTQSNDKKKKPAAVDSLLRDGYDDIDMIL